MKDITLIVDSIDTAFLPGDTIRGTATWTLDAQPRSIEARLFWHTQGKGTADTVVVAAALCPTLTVSSTWTFDLQLPPTAPYTYSGRLLSVMWAVEVVAEKKLGFARQELMVSPTGAPIEPYEVST